MKKNFLLFLALVLISCNDDKNKKADKDTTPIVTLTKEGKILAIDSTVLHKSKDSTVIDFYHSNNNKTFWLAFNCRESLIDELKNVEDEGLNRADFDLKKIIKFENTIGALSDKALIEYDILLTENLSKYVKKVANGTLSPKELYKDWDLKDSKINPKKLFLNFQLKDSFDYALHAVKPNHIIYRKLKHALKLINQFPDNNFEVLEAKDKIVYKDTHDLLPEIKKRLIYWHDLKMQDSITSIYDEKTLIGVKKFQSRHGLVPDGVIGKGTLSALNYSKKKRKEQIIVNMERWRWFPKQFEKEYILINIPDYKLNVVKKNDTIRTHRIIVGKSSRSTPILYSKLSYVVFNPTWTIPPTILKEDVIPAATKNRGYFASKNITIYDGNIEVSSADWNPAKAKSYRYVQPPGPTNSLGLVKIMFPNKHSVYLHDTNSRGYFGRENRSLSSGCVRVQNPFELTEYLLEDSINWTKAKIDEVLTEAKTKNVNFKKDIYLHILYWTAWSEGDKLQFRDDIYRLDFDLYKKLRN